uniref:Uncharacterized protein n=1 Tax=Coccidioides posadasii RMSCC 3488 TaxID=454284 RepID=A0A0J6FPK6_COCPO|nr:hypothetical protein CPAG_08606 [Coccidioides posadasii RMSCC 3488]
MSSSTGTRTSQSRGGGERVRVRGRVRRTMCGLDDQGEIGIREHKRRCRRRENVQPKAANGEGIRRDGVTLSKEDGEATESGNDAHLETGARCTGRGIRTLDSSAGRREWIDHCGQDGRRVEWALGWSCRERQ